MDVVYSLPNFCPNCKTLWACNWPIKCLMAWKSAYTAALVSPIQSGDGSLQWSLTLRNIHRTWMALNILSSPSLGNGICSDFQNRWKMHLYANLFSLQVGVDFSKIVPDMDFSKTVPDIIQLLKLCTWWTRVNCCFCYAEYVVESMCHSLRTQMCVCFLLGVGGFWGFILGFWWNFLDFFQLF